MFDAVLIANRGAIATRILRTLKTLGIRSVAVYHQEDAESLHVQRADEAICLGEGSTADTYLNVDKIIAAARDSGAQAIHPGYGFLSENTDLVHRCEQAGLCFIGPTAEQMTLFGLKHQARLAAQASQVPLVPGSPLLQDMDDALAWANDVGFPVMLKSTAGGGGIGMQLCADPSILEQAWVSVKRLSANYFANDGLFLEKYIARARHIEVQIFGDGAGTAIALGERDCSAQRRHQKVVEETPAPGLTDAMRQRLHDTAECLMASVNYRSAGTVEFIYDVDEGTFYFLEVNTRLQVEHGVTELVWGVDLVAWMLRQAAGEGLDLPVLKQALTPAGHAVQVRVYAEDPAEGFRPCAGLLSEVCWPAANGLRIDHWVESGVEVSALFDPMLAKVICHAPDRAQALANLNGHLQSTELYGIETNLAYLQVVLASDLCVQGRLLTNSLEALPFAPHSVTVLQAGTQSTIQDYPGRVGFWHVGVPPSGPMDTLAFRLANRLLDNPAAAAGLEITLNGPTLRFNCTSQVAITGVAIEASLDGVSAPLWEVIDVAAGQVLQLGKVAGDGARSYLAVRGGLQCPEYLGSHATFILGQFGGHAGRTLRAGDVLHLPRVFESTPLQVIALGARPVHPEVWQLRVIYGPHGAPDFFTEKDIAEFFEHPWSVHHNSSRTGVRLIGPHPRWARSTGGEAGLHPSNIHDNAYAFGTVDFTGDMPVILGPDGPSLGGFVCPATVIQADLWKLGQLTAGAQVRFVPVSHADAVALEQAQHQAISQLSAVAAVVATAPIAIERLGSPVIKRDSMNGEPVVYRLAGDHFVLLELGPLELDIERRFRIHALMRWLQDQPLSGMRELTPGIRSLQVHYDSQVLALDDLLAHLQRATAAMGSQQDLSVPSRIVHLPLSWDDEACRQAIDKYQQSVRPDAPWCPSNLEFIRRINGLADIDAVRDIVFNASYLVMGLGDVYLGAPVATPLDPRQRLVTTKYNPARTWTAENSVGIGGAYLCVYGMEGPGGYQFVGRTLQMWNRYRKTAAFEQPWLLRFFDQIRFYPVSTEELHQIRQDFPLGKYPLRVEDSTFSLAEYRSYLSSHEDAIATFQQQREDAFADELERWKASGQLNFQQQHPVAEEAVEALLPAGTTSADSPVSGSVWQVLVAEEQQVAAGEPLMILESMKMEIEVFAPHAGRVKRLLKRQGQSVTAGQALLWLEQSQ